MPKHRYISKANLAIHPLLCLSLLTGFMLTGCQKQPTDTNTQSPTPEHTTLTDTAVATTEDDSLPTYLVAVEAAYPPYAFKNEMGEVVGFDKDLLDAIGKKQGFHVKVLSQKWQTVFDSLQKEERDIIASGLSITDVRKKTIAFSESYITENLVAVIQGHPEVNTFSDLKNLSFVAQTGSTNLDIIKNYLGENKTHVKAAETSFLALSKMFSGKADAVFGEEGNLRYLANSIQKNTAKNSQQVRFLKFPDNQYTSYVAFGVKKGRDDDLLAKLNTGLVDIKTDGTYQKIHEKWFGKAE